MYSDYGNTLVVVAKTCVDKRESERRIETNAVCVLAKAINQNQTFKTDTSALALLGHKFITLVFIAL